MQRCLCKSYRPWKMLKNEYLVAKISVHTAENEPSKVCRSKQAIPTPDHKSGSAVFLILKPAAPSSRLLMFIARSFISISSAYPEFTWEDTYLRRLTHDREGGRGSIPHTPKLWEARSRLYRSQFLQVHTTYSCEKRKKTRVKALDEIYKIFRLLHVANPIWKTMKNASGQRHPDEAHGLREETSRSQQCSEYSFSKFRVFHNFQQFLLL